MNITDVDNYVGAKIGPDGHLRRRIAPRKPHVKVCSGINGPSKTLVERWVDFFFWLCLVLGFVRSIPARDDATLMEN